MGEAGPSQADTSIQQDDQPVDDDDDSLGYVEPSPKKKGILAAIMGGVRAFLNV